MKHFIPPFVILAGLLQGCANQPSARGQAEYQTVALQSARQTGQARLLNAQALQAIEKSDWGKAEQLLKQALTADVMFGPAHNNLGHVYFAQEKLYLAAWEFQYAARLMPYHPEPLNNLGMVFEAAGQFDQAMKSYSQALEKQPDHSELLGNLVRSRLRAGFKDDRTRELLDQLVLRETRDDWRHWAQTQRMLLGPAR